MNRQLLKEMQDVEMIRLSSIKNSGSCNKSFDQGNYTIGRSRSTDFPIIEQPVSRKHALLEVASKDRAYLTDLHSRNGTKVNGKLIGTAVSITDGDHIAFGDIEFLVEVVDEISRTSTTITVIDTDETKESSLIIPLSEAQSELPIGIFDDSRTAWALAEIGMVVVESDNLDEILSASLKLLRKAIGAERVAVVSNIDDPQHVSIEASCLARPSASSDFHVSSTIVRKIKDEQVAILVSNVEADSMFTEKSPTVEAGLRSMMAIPLLDGEKVLGILYSDSSLGGITFTEDHLRAFASFGHILSAKLANQALVQTRQAKIVAETELRISNEKREELARANHQLRDTQGQLVQSQKMAALGRIVACIVHELNTPLGYIKSNADLLRRLHEKLTGMAGNEASNPDEKALSQKALADDAGEALTNGIERVKQILISLKSFAGLDQAEWRNASLNEGIKTTINLIRFDLELSIEIKSDLGEIPEFYCSPAMLNQVVWALLTNAREALRGNGTILVRTWLADSSINIAISDDGCGMSEEQLNQVFDPGFTTKGGQIRMGMGLATCYRIIEQHHGTIHVDSELGVGTTVTISLPLKRSDT